jgi:prepilin-type N-terminal cleavage/methylation domain-containing protein
MRALSAAIAERREGGGGLCRIPGFSMVEMLVVILIMSVLLAIVVPTYMSVVPRSEIKSDASTVMNLLQRARMAASNYQRPIRVLIDCTDATRGGGKEPCRLEAQISLFDQNGMIKEWKRLQVSNTSLHSATLITYLRPERISLTKPNFSSYRALFNGFKKADGSGGSRTYGVFGEDSFAADSFVVLFTPSGEAVTNCSMEMRFANKHLGEKSNYVLKVVNSTGHIRVQGCAGAECLS